MNRPVIGLCAAIERARWSVWDDEAVLLPRSYATAIQRAGGLAVLLPPDRVEDPDEFFASVALPASLSREVAIQTRLMSGPVAKLMQLGAIPID